MGCAPHQPFQQGPIIGMRKFFTPSKLLKGRAKGMEVEDSFLVFLGLPQGSHIVHSFFTRG